MKDLKEYILEGIEDELSTEQIPNPLDYNTLKERVNLALVGDLRMYSDDFDDFKDRKLAVANAFKQKLSMPEINVERIERTKIFNYYILHLLESYKKNVDENMTLNSSSELELRHQLATDIILLIKNS